MAKEITAFAALASGDPGATGVFLNESGNQGKTAALETSGAAAGT
jgi:hypothetical protein